MKPTSKVGFLFVKGGVSILQAKFNRTCRYAPGRGAIRQMLKGKEVIESEKDFQCFACPGAVLEP